MAFGIFLIKGSFWLGRVDQFGNLWARPLPSSREGRSLHLFNVGLYCPLSQRQGRGRQSRLNTALNVLDFARFSHSQSWVASWINAQCSGNYFRYNPGQDLTMTRAGHVPRRPQYQAHRQSAQRKLQGNNVLRWLGNRYFSLASFIMAIM